MKSLELRVWLEAQTWLRFQRIEGHEDSLGADSEGELSKELCTTPPRANARTLSGPKCGRLVYCLQRRSSHKGSWSSDFKDGRNREIPTKAVRCLATKQGPH